MILHSSQRKQFLLWEEKETCPFLRWKFSLAREERERKVEIKEKNEGEEKIHRREDAEESKSDHATENFSVARAKGGEEKNFPPPPSYVRT